MYTPPRPPYLRYVALLGFLVLATVGGALLHPVVALAPVLAVTVVWVVLKIPIRYPVLALTYLALAVDYVAERPQYGLWQSPLFPLGELMYGQLSNITKIGALRFPLVDVLILGLLGLAMYRRVTGSKIDPPVPPMPRPLAAMVALSLVGIMYMEIRGMARGGDFKNSLWQWHQAAMLPFIVAMYHYALRGPEDWPAVVKAIIAAALTKTVVGVYFATVIVPQLGVYVEYTTSHSDSMTFNFCLLVAIMRFLEKPKLAHLLKGIPLMVCIITAMIYNDRRLAYVSLVGCLLAGYLISPWPPIKKLFSRAMFLLAPVLIVYFTVGWNMRSSVFAPVHKFRTLIDGEGGEGNWDYRDIENWDVIHTWMEHPILGTGYGHEFLEPMPLPDIAFVFPTYRFHPHNSLLGLLAFGGMLGYTLVWLYLITTVYMAVRAYHRAHHSEHRAASLIIVGIMAGYVNQVYGDMGIISYLCTFLVAVCVAMSGKLAVATGAWPMPHSHLVGSARVAPVAPPGTISHPNEDGQSALPSVARRRR
ncbi:MAG TPA: exopolysaccharide repeat unit polymerase [Myxococcus sp.]|nr:exopolysaccharide repeat unit polymerase [Myxococcus sp.]